LAKRIERKDLQSRILFNLGHLAERQGEWKEAVEFYNESLSLCQLVSETQLASKAEDAIKRLETTLQTQTTNP